MRRSGQVYASSINHSDERFLRELLFTLLCSAEKGTMATDRSAPSAHLRAKVETKEPTDLVTRPSRVWTAYLAEFFPWSPVTGSEIPLSPPALRSENDSLASVSCCILNNVISV